jgi:ribosomal protein L11 methyltransferase
VTPSRLWPAIDIVPRASDPGEPLRLAALEELLLAALDGTGLTAWQEHDGGWRAFFAGAPERDRAVALLRDHPLAALAVTPVDVPDEDWAARSQANVTAVRVGRVVLTPPWAVGTLTDPAEPDVIEVVIQPSMGFGTGHHASTRLCTALLQRIPLAGRALVDIGTGSGVLAIVGHRLGAMPVVAIDNDADAIDSARENLELNDLVGAVDLRVGDFRTSEPLQAAVVTANLTGGLLVRSATTLAACVAPGGCLIVSGVTLAEEAEVVSAFEPTLRLAERIGEDEWVGLLFVVA